MEMGWSSGAAPVKNISDGRQGHSNVPSVKGKYSFSSFLDFVDTRINLIICMIKRMSFVFCHGKILVCKLHKVYALVNPSKYFHL